MNKILLILLLGISNLSIAQIDTTISGKIIDEKLTCIIGVRITNLNNGEESISDQNGRFRIITSEHDMIEFEMIGLTTERIKINNSTQILNVIMIDKDVNCLGADWSERQYQKAYRQIEKYLDKLYRKAGKQNVWNNSSC